MLYASKTHFHVYTKHEFIKNIQAGQSRFYGFNHLDWNVENRLKLNRYQYNRCFKVKTFCQRRNIFETFCYNSVMTPVNTDDDMKMVYYTNITFQQDYLFKATACTISFCKKNSLKVFCIVGVFIYAFVHKSSSFVVPSSNFVNASLSARSAYIAQSQAPEASTLQTAGSITNFGKIFSHQTSFKPYINTMIKVTGQGDINPSFPTQFQGQPRINMEASLVRPHPQRPDSFFFRGKLRPVDTPNQHQNRSFIMKVLPKNVEIGYNELRDLGHKNVYDIRKSTVLSYKKKQSAHQIFANHSIFADVEGNNHFGFKVGYHHDPNPNQRSCWILAFQLDKTNQINVFTQKQSQKFLGQNFATTTGALYEGMDPSNVHSPGGDQATPPVPTMPRSDHFDTVESENQAEPEIQRHQAKSSSKAKFQNNVKTNSLTSITRSKPLKQQKSEKTKRVFAEGLGLLAGVFIWKSLTSIATRPNTSNKTKNIVEIAKIGVYVAGSALVFDAGCCCVTLSKDYVETQGPKLLLNTYYNWQRNTKMEALEKGILPSVLCSLCFAWFETFGPGLGVTLLMLRLLAGLNSGDQDGKDGKGDDDDQGDALSKGSPNQPKPPGPPNNGELVELTPDVPVGEVSGEPISFQGSEKAVEEPKQMSVQKPKFLSGLRPQLPRFFKNVFKP